MLIFIKLGGSLITDKTRESLFLEDRMRRLAAEIASAWQNRAFGLQLLIGHGSGSFGHFAAQKYGTMAGVETSEQWQGVATVARTAAHLNFLVRQALAEHGLPVWSFQPSASALAEGGKLAHLALDPIRAALAHDLVPLIYGDVALDASRGATIISTEGLFSYLAPRLRPQHIFLLGEVPGVLDEQGALIRQVTPGSLSEIEAALGGSRGVDVTGGMASKVREMLALAVGVPNLQVHVFSGLESGLLEAAIANPQAAPGTIIRAD